jgi:hypothetical protein
MHVKPYVKTNKSDYIDAHAFRRQAFGGGRWEHHAVVHDATPTRTKPPNKTPTSILCD